MAGSFLSGFDWGGLISTVAPKVIGGLMATDANDRAAQVSEQNAAANRAAVEAANARAVGYLQPRIQAGAPATGYFRTVMAQDPSRLTPSQTIRMNDVQLQANRSVPTALRGSGRAVSSMVNDTVNRANAGMVQENQARSDAAAGRLESSGDYASGQAAGIESGQGNQITNINTGAATDRGNAITGSGAVMNDTIGNIGAYFANAAKTDALKGQYGAPKATTS